MQKAGKGISNKFALCETAYILRPQVGARDTAQLAGRSSSQHETRVHTESGDACLSPQLSGGADREDQKLKQV